MNRTNDGNLTKGHNFSGTVSDSLCSNIRPAGYLGVGYVYLRGIDPRIAANQNQQHVKPFVCLTQDGSARKPALRAHTKTGEIFLVRVKLSAFTRRIRYVDQNER